MHVCIHDNVLLYMTLYQLLFKQKAIKNLTDNLRVNKVSDEVLEVSACTCRAVR